MKSSHQMDRQADRREVRHTGRQRVNPRQRGNRGVRQVKGQLMGQLMSQPNKKSATETDNEIVTEAGSEPYNERDRQIDAETRGDEDRDRTDLLSQRATNSHFVWTGQHASDETGPVRALSVIKRPLNQPWISQQSMPQSHGRPLPPPVASGGQGTRARGPSHRSSRLRCRQSAKQENIRTNYFVIE